MARRRGLCAHSIRTGADVTNSALADAAITKSTDSLPTIDQFRRQSSGVAQAARLEVDQEMPEHFAVLLAALDPARAGTG
ncbi:hypothetical protein X759_20960 [Mesorhizobium sp. LSHC420B00]|nr:hypothetical protein X759_20960 [Mesorhizobium sp. LSHC420B00]